MKPKSKATHEDVYIGSRIRKRRLDAGLSQASLAKNVGISYQQIQKYESGQNRVSATMLNKIAKTLKRNISFFLPKEKCNKLKGGV